MSPTSVSYEIVLAVSCAAESVTVNANGDMISKYSLLANFHVNVLTFFPVKRSSHFLQAYSLLNLHMIHTSEVDGSELEAEQNGRRPSSPRGFKIYSPLSAETVVGSSMSLNDDLKGTENAPPAFTAGQLLDVMRRLADPRRPEYYIPYFPLCRAFGVQAVDDMVRARVLELRWVDTVTPEWESGSESVDPRRLGTSSPLSQSTTHIQDSGLGSDHKRVMKGSELESLGPKLLPTTPIVRYAMREVLKEYSFVGEDTSTRGNRESRYFSDDRSDYASLSTVDEY